MTNTKYSRIVWNIQELSKDEEIRQSLINI